MLSTALASVGLLDHQGGCDCIVGFSSTLKLILGKLDTMVM